MTNIWDILGMAPTTDVERIREAFIRALREASSRNNGNASAVRAAYREAVRIARKRGGGVTSQRPREGFAAPTGNLQRLRLGGAVMPDASPNTSPEMSPDAPSDASPASPAPSGAAGIPAAARACTFATGTEASATTPAGLSFPPSAPASGAGGPVREEGPSHLEFPSAAPENAQSENAQPVWEDAPALRFPAGGSIGPTGEVVGVAPAGLSFPPSAPASGAGGPVREEGPSHLEFPSAAPENAQPENAQPVWEDAPALRFPPPEGSGGAGAAASPQEGPREGEPGGAIRSPGSAPGGAGGGPLLVPGVMTGADTADVDAGDVGLGGLVFPLAVGAGILAAGGAMPPPLHSATADAQREACAELAARMRAQFLDDAPLEVWEEWALSADFRSLCRAPEWVRACTEVCREGLSPSMAAVLYPVYGAADTELGRLVRAYVCMPASPVGKLAPLPLARLKEQTAAVLAGIERLCGERQGVYLWQQALQNAPFVEVRHQPYFVLRLGEFVQRPGLPLELRQVLAQAYAEFWAVAPSPCAQRLCAALPEPTAFAPWPKPEPFAARLLLAGAGDFHAAARDALMELLRQTRTGFATSRREEPWTYVFEQPHFALLRGDAAFVDMLCAFTGEKPLPDAFWSALRTAFGDAFAALPPPDAPAGSVEAALWRLRQLVEAQAASRQRRGLGERLRGLFRRHPLLLGVALVYCVVAAHACTVNPWLGAALVLLPPLVLFL